MPRPRTPSNILEFRGSFKKNPQRRRQDAQGKGEFCVDAPKDLPPAAHGAWKEIVDRLPECVLTKTDEIAVSIAARLLAQYNLTCDIDTLKELRVWFSKLGMTPVDRTRLPSKPSGSKNPFSDL